MNAELNHPADIPSGNQICRTLRVKMLLFWAIKCPTTNSEDAEKKFERPPQWLPNAVIFIPGCGFGINSSTQWLQM